MERITYLILFALLISCNNTANKDIYLLSEVEIKPTYPGGSDEFHSYLMEKIPYLPDTALSINRKIIIEFIVDEQGNISNTNIVKGVTHFIDSIAVKTISSSKAWIPGKIKGRNVKTKVYLPISFDN